MSTIHNTFGTTWNNNNFKELYSTFSGIWLGKKQGWLSLFKFLMFLGLMVLYIIFFTMAPNFSLILTFTVILGFGILLANVAYIILEVVRGRGASYAITSLGFAFILGSLVSLIVIVFAISRYPEIQSYDHKHIQNITVAQAQFYYDYNIFGFTNGFVATKYIGEFYKKTISAVEEYWCVAPIVSDSNWNRDIPISAWAFCSTGLDPCKKAFEEINRRHCLDRWNYGVRAGIKIRSYYENNAKQAIFDAILEYNLTVTEKSPIMYWENPKEAINSWMYPGKLSALFSLVPWLIITFLALPYYLFFQKEEVLHPEYYPLS